MKDFLVIIESTHKIQIVNELLNKAGHRDFKVVATKGRIRDLPSDRMGINLTDYSFEEEYASESTINFIKEQSNKFATTYICTDSDNEGEKIAFDLMNIVNNKSKRVIIRAYTPEALTESLNNPVQLNEERIKAQVAKRLFDRLISSDVIKSNLPPGSEVNGIGRVLTPTLSLISESPPKSGVVYRDFESNGELVRLVIDCYSMNEEQISEVAEVIASASDIEFSLTNTREMVDSSTFWNGKQAMVNIASSLNMGVQEVFDHLQDLYTHGMISYFRTDTCDISKEDASKLSQLALENGINIDSVDSIIERSVQGNRKLSQIEKQQHGHGALIPLSSSIDPMLSLSLLSDRDKVYSLLLRHTLKAMKKPARITQKDYAPNLNKNNKFWNALIKYNVKYKAINRTIKPIDRPVTPYYPETNPNGVSLGTKKPSHDCGYRAIQADLAVSMVLVRSGLARPSTFAYHATKIAKAFINDKNELNARAMKALNSAKGVSETLCAPNTYHELEKIFSSKNTLISQMLDESLELIGVSKETSKTTSRKEKTNDFSLFN